MCVCVCACACACASACACACARVCKEDLRFTETDLSECLDFIQACNLLQLSAR